MIFPRSSVSEEKHQIHNIFRQSVQSGSENSHTDDVTLLEDQEQHLEAQPYLSGKHVNKTARTWVEAKVDWRLQWLGALVVYILVVLAAWFGSYRHQYKSVLVTTSTDAIPPTGDPFSWALPQVALVAQDTGMQTQLVRPVTVGLTTTPNATSAFDIVPCQYSSQSLPGVPSASNETFLLNLDSCIINSTYQAVVIVMVFSGVGAQPPLMFGAFPPAQSPDTIASSIISDTTSTPLSYLPQYSNAQIFLSSSLSVPLSGQSTTTYSADVQRIPLQGDNAVSHTTSSFVVPPSTSSIAGPTWSFFEVTDHGTTSIGSIELWSTVAPITTTSSSYDVWSSFSEEVSSTNTTPFFTSTATSSSAGAATVATFSTSTAPTFAAQFPSVTPRHFRETPTEGDSSRESDGVGAEEAHPTPTAHPRPRPPPSHHHGGDGDARFRRQRERGGPISPPQSLMTIVIQYKTHTQTVLTETRRMSIADIFFNCLSLLSVFLLTYEIIGRVGGWWIRRRLSKRFHLD